MRSLTAALLLGASLVAGACAGASGGIYVRTGPPPVRREVVLVSPGPGYVWVPGYYRYERSAYVWVGGRYERPPRGRTRWVEGHWRENRSGWYYVEGHWR
jgi:WXXGXW repeat (2 copies)